MTDSLKPSQRDLKEDKERAFIYAEYRQRKIPGVFKNFGLQLKYGLYDSYGANKEMLKDLVMFYSSKEKALVTLSEYVSRMNPEQKNIYYASGESTDKIDKLPQTELLKDKGYEILYLTDDIDEFALQILHDFDEKEFKSVSADDLDWKNQRKKKKRRKNRLKKARICFST